MKKYIPLLLAGMLLAGCRENKAPTTQHGSNYVRQQHKVYHFADGRVGYRDDTTMIWWWMIMNQPNNYSTVSRTGGGSTSPSPTYLTGSWSRGAAPSSKDLEEAQESDLTVVEEMDGTPATPSETEALEASEQAEQGVQYGADAGEPQSAATPEDTEGQPSEGVAGEPSSSEPSSDAGSSDSGSSDGGGSSD